MGINREGVIELRCRKCGWRVSRVEWDQILFDPGCPDCGEPWVYFQDVAPSPNKKAIDA